MDWQNFKLYRKYKGGKWYRYYAGPDDIPQINWVTFWLPTPDPTSGNKLIGYEEYPWKKEDLKEDGRKDTCESLEKEMRDREDAHKRLANKAKSHKFDGDLDNVRFDFIDMTNYLKKTMPIKGFVCTGAIKRRLLFYLEAMGFDIDVPIKKYGIQAFPDYGNCLVEDIYIELTKMGHIMCVSTHSYLIK